MKKIYKSPEMDVIKLKHQQTLLAGSLPKGDDYNGEGVGAPEFEWDDTQF